jgi:UDP-glucose 4-epimerase
MRILITGGAGFCGSHLCEKYTKEDHTVLCYDNFLSGSLDNIKHLLDYRNFKLIKGDIRDKVLLEKVIDGVDVIFHLAAQIHVDRSYIEPELTWDINVSGTQNILELARFYDVKRVIYASSSEVYGSAKFVPMTEKHELSAPHPYGASKIAADRMCFAYQSTYGMDIVIMRPFNIFGQRQRDIGYGAVISLFTRRVLNNISPMIYGDGLQRREYVFIDDIVQAYDRVLHHSGLVHEPVNFATGIDYSIKEIAEMVIEACEKDIKPVHVEKRMAEVERLCGDATRARIIYGWTPLVSMKDGMKKFCDWYKVFGFERGLDVR